MDELALEAEARVARLDSEGDFAPTGERGAEISPPATAPAAAVPAAKGDEVEEEADGELTAPNVGVTPPPTEDDSRLARPKLGAAWPDGRRRRVRSSWADVFEVEPAGGGDGSMRWLWLGPVELVVLVLALGAPPSKRAPSSDARRWLWTIIARR